MITDSFRQLLRFVLLYFVRRVLLLLGALLSFLYNVLFAWWLDDWTFKGRQSRFEREIRSDGATIPGSSRNTALESFP